MFDTEDALVSERFQAWDRRDALQLPLVFWNALYFVFWGKRPSEKIVPCLRRSLNLVHTYIYILSLHSDPD